MNSLTAIKHGVHNLYKTNPHIHMNVSISNAKIHLKKHPVTIIAVYPNIFLVEDQTGTTFTVQYVELMMGHVEIVELMQK